MSRSVKAQREANQANIAMQHEANQWNYDIAHEANEWNWANLQAQNEWNLQQWERENAYNDPSAQMDRLIRAGINPIFGLGSVDTGNAQHLESGSPHAAVVPTMHSAHVEPEYDRQLPEKVGNILASSRDLVNAAIGFRQLGINEFNAETSRSAQQSAEQLNKATTAQRKAATTAIEIENKWNTRTFDVRCEMAAQTLSTERSKTANLDASTEAYKSAKAKDDAQAEFIRVQTERVAEDYELRWQNLAVARRQVAAQEGSVAVARENLSFHKAYAEAEVKKWSNDQRLAWLTAFGSKIEAAGKLSASAGSDYLGAKVAGEASAKSQHVKPSDEAILNALGYQSLQLYAKDPSPENAKVAAEASRLMNNYLDSQFRAIESYGSGRNDVPLNTSNSSVLNPSSDDGSYMDNFGFRP